MSATNKVHAVESLLYLEEAFREKDFYGLFQDGQEAPVMDAYAPL